MHERTKEEETKRRKLNTSEEAFKKISNKLGNYDLVEKFPAWLVYIRRGANIR